MSGYRLAGRHHPLMHHLHGHHLRHAVRPRGHHGLTVRVHRDHVYLLLVRGRLEPHLTPSAANVHVRHLHRPGMFRGKPAAALC